MAKIKKSQDGGKLNRLGPTPLISRPKEKPVPIPPPTFLKKFSKPSKASKPMMKAKNGKSFPDLNKDGKVTRADILKGRGVIAQNGTAIKQQNWKKDYDSKVKGVKGMSENEKLKKGITRLAPVKKAMKMGGKMKTCKGGC